MIKKLFTLYAFVISTFMVISGILGANNFIELTTALSFSLLSFYFTVLMLPRSNKVIKNIDNENVLELIPDTIDSVKKSSYDPERRKFLKLIGAAGGSLFLMTIFTRSTEASFFGSMPGPGTVAIKNTQGVAIDPAEKKPTDGYSITEIDDSGTDAYYGFVNKDGGWFILKDSNGIYRYAKGSSSFSVSWAIRASLTYDYFNVVF